MIRHNQFVEVRFKNGIFFDAYIESWNDKRAVLRLPTEEKIIVFAPAENVLLIKILNEKSRPPAPPPIAIVPPKPLKPLKPASEVQKEFDELKEQKKDDLSLMRMAELKDELNKLEREEYLKKARSLKPSGVRMVEYGTPGNIKIARPAEHSATETTGEDPSFNSSLQGLFAEKD